ncbi:MAG: diguanylate cyclase [Spirochaetaceae bacterium]
MDPQSSLIDSRILEAWSVAGVGCWDVDSGIGFGGRLWTSLGLDGARFRLEDWFMRIHTEDQPKVRAEYDRIVNGEAGRGLLQYRFYGYDGEIHWVESDWTLIPPAAEGQGRRIAAVDRDITVDREREAELLAAKDRAERSAYEADVLRRAGAVVSSTLDVDHMLTLILDQMKPVVPYDTASVQLLRDNALEVVGGAGWDNLDEIRGLRFPFPGETPNVRVLAQSVPLRFDDVVGRFPAFPLSNFEQNIRSWMGVPLMVHGKSIGVLTFDNAQVGAFTSDHLRLATAFGEHVAVALSNAQLFEETERLAMTDSLTGLLSRRAFFMNARAFFEHARRYDHCMALLMIDIDYFKRINDEYGHGAGDDALVAVASVIRETLRDSDIVGRYGGEEFIALLPETRWPEAVDIAERVRHAVTDVKLSFSDERLTISIGVSVYDSTSDLSLQDIIEQSDRACYLAKATGRNRVTPLEV